jgi:hypothetical protein
MAQHLVKFTHIQGCKGQYGSLKCNKMKYKKYFQKMQQSVCITNWPRDSGYSSMVTNAPRWSIPKNHFTDSCPPQPFHLQMARLQGRTTWTQRAPTAHTCCYLWQNDHMAVNTVHFSRPLHYIGTSPHWSEKRMQDLISRNRTNCHHMLPFQTPRDQLCYDASWRHSKQLLQQDITLHYIHSSLKLLTEISVPPLTL